jgi:CBS domain-containing protein
MSAAEKMSYPIVSLRPETTLEECCKTMESNKVRRILVVDDAGEQILHELRQCLKLPNSSKMFR